MRQARVLIEQPAVQHDVHRAVRSLDLDRPEQFRPVLRHLVENGIEIDRAIMGDQRPRVSDRPRLPDERDDFGGLARGEIHVALQRRARIEASSGCPRQRSLSDQRRGCRKSTVAAEKLCAVRRPRRLSTAKIGKGDTAGEGDAPWIAGQHRAGGRIDLRRDERTRGAAGCAEHPLRVSRDRQPARPA